MPASGMQSAAEQPDHADRVYAPEGQPAAEVIRVGSPASLLAAVPVVLKFQPSELSLVVLGVIPPRSEVAVTVRYDIDGLHSARTVARHVAGILGVQRIKAAYAVGYGPGDVVTPMADALRAIFTETGIEVKELLRVHDGRYWSYVCADPACCPPEGTEYDLAAHPITRKHAGQVLASREALAATLAPVTGELAESMRRASRAARQRASRLAAGLARRAVQGKAGRRALLEPSLQATKAIDLYRSGGRFESHKDAAWLALALKDLAVRDDAWARMIPEHRKAHLRLWTDLTTLARGSDAVAPATLLAFVAWQDGDGALANVALDRAVAVTPGYSMAQLLREALDSGAPPSMARLPMTPEDVAAAYGYAEDDEDGGGQATAPEQASGCVSGDAEDEADPAAEAEGTAVPAAALAVSTV